MVFNALVTKKQYSRIKPFILKFVVDFMNNIDKYNVDTLTYDLPSPYKDKGEQVYNAFLSICFPYQATLPGELYDDFMAYDYCRIDGRIKLKPRKIKELYELNNKIDNELNNIVNSLSLVNKSQMLQAKEIHDFVCNKMHYCHKEDGTSHYACEFYDLVFGDCCVCNGYSRLYLALCDKAGIECNYVANSDHAWNRVHIDGKYYFVDCTWDDGEPIKWTYCLIPKKDFYGKLNHPRYTKVVRSYWKI